MFGNSVMFVMFIVVCGLWSMGQSSVVRTKRPFQGGSEKKNNVSELDCSQFIDDYDILRQFPFPVKINLAAEEDNVVGESVAFMGKNDTYVNILAIYEENVVPPTVFCLSNLHSLKIERTPFENSTIFLVCKKIFILIIYLDIIPDAFANFKNLKNIWVYDSPIVKITEKLETYTSLEMLILNNCSLTYVPNLSNLQNLWSLGLSNNHLSRVDGIPDVEFLDIDGNFFTEIPITKNRDKLMFLDMNHNPLKNAVSIMYYNNLEGIYLKNTSLTSIPPPIDKLRKLKALILSDNKLTYIPTNVLDLPLLQQLDISNNKLSPKDIQLIRKEFKKSHPELKLTV